MDDVKALELINDELLAHGHPPVVMPEWQRRVAFQSLQIYAKESGRPLEVAVKDLVRFQLQGEELEQLRSQS